MPHVYMLCASGIAYAVPMDPSLDDSRLGGRTLRLCRVGMPPLVLSTNSAGAHCRCAKLTIARLVAGIGRGEEREQSHRETGEKLIGWADAKAHARREITSGESFVPARTGMRRSMKRRRSFSNPVHFPRLFAERVCPLGASASHGRTM